MKTDLDSQHCIYYRSYNTAVYIVLCSKHMINSINVEKCNCCLIFFKKVQTKCIALLNYLITNLIKLGQMYLIVETISFVEDVSYLQEYWLFMYDLSF